MVENWFVFAVPSVLRPGDMVRVKYISGNIDALVDDTTHVISDTSDDRTRIKLVGVDIQGVAVGSIRFDRIDFTEMDLGRILTKNNSSVVFNAYCGDMITGGEFVIRQGKHIIARYRIENQVINWGELNAYQVMYVGEYVHYKGIRYRVTKAHIRSEISGTPDNELRHYVIDMIPITDSTYYID